MKVWIAVIVAVVLIVVAISLATRKGYYISGESGYFLSSYKYWWQNKDKFKEGDLR